jgi:hypothetical protein
MRRARPNHDAESRRGQSQHDSDRRETGTADGSIDETPLAALHRAGGNQAVQSAADGEQGARSPTTSTSRDSGNTGELDREIRSPSTQTADEGTRLQRTSTSSRRESVVERMIQPKLTVSGPTDRDEREADRVAEAVMRSEKADRSRIDGRTPALQRMCSRCRERFQRGKPLDCEECEAKLQRATDSGDGRTLDDDSEVAQQVRRARSGGRRLPQGTRSYFESRMGQDFGDVRVHTGSQADRAARSVNARAFTLGSDVVFRSGEYRPDTRSGKRLLAHELTHVVQQGGGRGASRSRAVIQRQSTSGGTRSSSGPDTISCSTDDSSHVRDAHQKAVSLTDTATDTFADLVMLANGCSDLAEFGRNLNRKDSVLAGNLRTSFGLPIPDRNGNYGRGGGTTDRTLGAVTDALQRIHDTYSETHSGLVAGGYDYECNENSWVPFVGCKPGTNAYVREEFFGEEGTGNFHICPDANWSDASELAETLVHEATHYFAETEDYEIGRNSLTNAYSYGENVGDFQNPL